MQYASDGDKFLRGWFVENSKSSEFNNRLDLASSIQLSDCRTRTETSRKLSRVLTRWHHRRMWNLGLSMELFFEGVYTRPRIVALESS